MNSNDRAIASSARRVTYIVLSVVLACGVLWLLTGALSVSHAAVPERVQLPQAALARSDDPVVVTGEHFPELIGAPLNEFVAYAYRGGQWNPIPFQIDEVNISNTFVTIDDGLLGNRDELVFMAGDAGASASATEWPVDVPARLNSRYEITVSDPLSVSQQAWVYLYRSTTLTRSTASYITWTFATQTASALSYTASFSPTKFVGLSDLLINGRNTDILDRQKLRLVTLVSTFNEQTLVTPPFGKPATLTLPIAGPVRAAVNDGPLKAAFYGSQLDFDVTFDLSSVSAFGPQSIRTSFDWISPTVSGINTYYDSNTPGGVPIDGVPDVISTTPRADWLQVNGDNAGPGGLVIALPSLSANGGTPSQYYADNQANVGGDTGDLHSYGDAGPYISHPGAVVSLTLLTYILPTGTDANVGANYYARASHPLQAHTLVQCYAPAGHCLKVYLPLITRN